MSTFNDQLKLVEFYKSSWYHDIPERVALKAFLHVVWERGLYGLRVP